jgi:hypothetical protein
MSEPDAATAVGAKMSEYPLTVSEPVGDLWKLVTKPVAMSMLAIRLLL